MAIGSRTFAITRNCASRTCDYEVTGDTDDCIARTVIEDAERTVPTHIDTADIGTAELGECIGCEEQHEKE
jgi:hypothetical protein